MSPSMKAEDTNPHGISWPMAACFLIGELAGAGMLALPVALVNGGVVFGTMTSFLCALCAAYSGVLIGDNLMIMRRRWPEYREHNGKPYMEMARRSMGAFGERCVKIMLYSATTGITIVFILLAANNISTFLNGNYGIHVHKCLTIVLVGLILWPLVMPRSPMEFGWIAVLATLSTCVAIVITIWAVAHDLPTCAPVADYTGPKSIETMALTFGTLMFAYGGLVVFPTIQMDMKRPGDFWKSVWFTYFVLFFVMFTPLSLFGFYVYGNSMVETIIGSMQVNWMQQAVGGFITIHVIAAYIIMYSPLVQGIETFLHVPKDFSLSRFVIRSTLLWFTVFVALTVPRFGVILDLVGGFFCTLMSLVFPGLFHLLLTAGEKRRKERIERGEIDPEDEDNEGAGLKDIFSYNRPHIIILVAVMAVIGILGGISSTGTAFTQLLGAEMELPCYVQLFTSRGFSMENTGGSVNCCGVGRNVTVFTGQRCARY